MLGKTVAPEIKKPIAAENRSARSTSRLDEAARASSDEVMGMLVTSPAGLSEEEAATRLEEQGPNEVAYEKKENWMSRLWVAARNP